MPSCAAGENGFGRTSFLVQARRGLFGGARHSQQLLSENLTNVLVAVAARQELPGQVDEPGDIFEALRHRGDAVEVRTESDVIDAGDVADMIDVVRHLR